MKTVVKHLVAAALFGVVAGLFLTGGRVERRLAAAQRDLATLNVAASARTYEEIAPYLDYAERIPWMWSDLRHDIRARHAAIRYWRFEYESLVADYRDLNSPDARNNLALQFIVANAAYRASQRVEPDRQEVLGALDHAIGVYFRVLQNSVGHVDAAFNYEYVIRLRDDIARAPASGTGISLPPAESAARPSGVRETDQTACVCIRTTRRQRPEARSHSRTAPSGPADAAHLPSGDTVTV